MNTRLSFKQGDQVRYHPIIGEAHDGKVYTVRDRGDSNGRAVYWLEGKPGFVCAEAVTAATDDAE